MTKISLLPSDTAPSLTDSVATFDVETASTKRVTLSDIKTLLLPQQTRRAEFFIQADGIAGTTASNNEGPEVLFTGTPTGYGRARVLIPKDYVASTSAKIILMFRSDSANNQALTYFVGSRATNGASFTAWNIANSLTSGAIGLTANVTSEFLLSTLASTSIASGNVINIAVRPASAVTGNLYLYAAVLEYTATV